MYQNKNRFLAVLLILALMIPSIMLVVHGQDECNFAEETIKFGGLAPMSAPGAVAGGVAMDWAFKKAADDINADCGIKIGDTNYQLEVITGDSEGSPEKAQAAAERLILDEGVNGMVGVYHSAVGLATMGIMQENQIPTVFSEPWNDNVSANGIQDYENQPARITANDAGIDYIFRIAPSSTMVGSVATDWMKAMGFTDIVWIVENTDYGQPAAADEIARMQEAGAKTEKLDVELGTEDFLPVLSRIQARPTPPDMIRILVTGETSFNITEQMAELGIAPNTDTACMTNQIAFQSEQFWATVPDGNYCTFQRVGIIPALFNDKATALNDAYEADFGDIVASFAMESYDSVWILADAMERAGTYTDGAAIATALEDTDITLSQGHYYFEYTSKNPVPDGVPAFMWHQWPDPIVTVMQYFEPNQSSLDAAVIWPPTYQTHGTQYIMPGTKPDM